MECESGTWNEWRIHVLKELERQDNNWQALKDKFDTFEKECIKNMGNQNTINVLTNYKLYIIFAVISFVTNIVWTYVFWKLTNH